jgi:hypothetical protein
MRDEYLWDRSGPADVEVERLEKLLAPLRYRPAAQRRMPYAAIAAAAAVVLAALGIWRSPVSPAPATGWQVARVQGAARIGNRDASVAMTLHAGQVLRTAPDAHLELQDDALGTIELGPDSVLRAATARQVTLGRGSLHAFLWAPPRQFVVETPSARAVDLGCEYTIDVNPAGDGLLRVAMGWVAFQFQGRESFIPAGAECVTRRRTGPGIPFYEDAPEAMRQALDRFERGDGAALGGLLQAARPRDGITLWHLLTRVPPQARGAVFDRFVQLVKLPGAENERGRILRGDPAAIDLCWNALGLENTGWWRGWERNWPPQAKPPISNP